MRLKLAILIVLLFAAPGWGATYTIGSGETLMAINERVTKSGQVFMSEHQTQ